MAGFARESLDLTNDNWSDIERYNESLERLIARRKSEVLVTGPLVESKTAWKCAVLQQSLLYRVCALATATAAEWKAGNIVACVLAARALLETIALGRFIRTELLRLREPMNMGAAQAIDNLCNEHLFATKDEKLVADGFGNLARSILNFIDKFNKDIPGVRHTYEFLSEWAHPNGSGHFFTYGEINKETGHVTFHESAPRVVGIQGHVIACYMLILFFELVMDTFDETIVLVGKVDEGLGPWVPGAIASMKR
jgi:hypothetical protein